MFSGLGLILLPSLIPCIEYADNRFKGLLWKNSDEALATKGNPADTVGLHSASKELGASEDLDEFKLSLINNPLSCYMSIRKDGSAGIRFADGKLALSGILNQNGRHSQNG